MANNCFYTIKAVSKDKNALERLIKIMNYEDNEYYIYRCFSAYKDDEYDKNDLYVIMISGDCAWSCVKWFDNQEVFTDKDENNAHYVTLDILCEKLKIGIELFSEEPGVGFQEHYVVHSNGNKVVDEEAEWIQKFFDEDGEELDEPIEEGGFDNYCSFADAEEIYGEE